MGAGRSTIDRALRREPTLPERAASDVASNTWLDGQEIRVLRFPARKVWSAERRLDMLATVAAAARASSTTLRVVPLLRG